MGSNHFGSLIYHFSEESVNKDFEELEELSTNAGRTSSSVVGSSGDSWEVKFKELERTHKTIKEQKVQTRLYVISFTMPQFSIQSA